MGIPGLLTALRPYSERKRLDSESSRLNIVIDGPGMAHHIYNREFAPRSFNYIPDYYSLGAAAILFLEQMEQAGFEITEIYFDGLLPTSKDAVRRERKQKSVDQLVAYKRDSPERLTESPNRLPASPFVVPTVIEALLHSSFRERTFVVPHEADEFCAGAMHLGGRDTVLTSDTDCMLSCPKVILFQDLELRIEEPDIYVAVFQHFDMERIMNRLGIQDIYKFGFYFARDITRNISAAARRSITFDMSHPNDREGWRNFQQQFGREYSRTDADVTNPVCALHSTDWTEPLTEFHDVIICLDTTISELVQQWLWNLSREYSSTLLGWTLKSPFGEPAETERIMHLPLMLDDPDRASSWRGSLFVRRFAYSILAVQGAERTMIEADRHGARYAASIINLISAAELPDEMTCLSQTIQKIIGALSPNQTTEIWPCVAIFLLLETAFLRDENEFAPQILRDEVKRVFCVEDEIAVLRSCGLYSWNVLHLKAQVEAMLYSLRILKQVIDVYVAANFADDPEGPFLLALDDLRNELSSLPGINDMMITGPTTSFMLGETRDQFLIELGKVEWFKDISDEEPDEEPSGRKRKRRRQQSTEDVPSEQQAVAENSSNMYAILDGLVEDDG